jgi:hypothetical protein
MADFSEINSEVNAVLPTNFTITHDLPLSAEETAKRKDDRIAALEAQVSAQQVRGNNRMVETPDGERSLDDVLKEATAYRLAQATEAIRQEQAAAARDEQLRQTRWKPNGEVGWAPDQETLTPICGTMGDVVKEVGLSAHKWSTAQKAIATTTRQSAVDALVLEKYWGNKSSAVAATELLEKNPLLYALGKKRALKEGKY